MGTFSRGRELSYSGPWEDDTPGLGEVKVLYPDGYRYSGAMRAGKRHGRGELLGANGERIYSGQWKYDLMNGEGELVATDGKYTGQFANGLREGEGYFEYNHPAVGSTLPQPPSSSEKGARSKQR